MENNEKIQSETKGTKIVETYAEDMAKVIQGNSGGLIKKIIHGEEEHEEAKRNLSPEARNNKIFVFVGLLLLIIALSVIAFFFFRKTDNAMYVAPQFAPIVFNDKTTFTEIAGLKKDDVIQAIVNEVNNTEVKMGGLEGIYLTDNKNVVGFKEFNSLIESNFVPSDASFINDNFLMGVVNGQTKDFFILLKVSSTQDVFGSFRTWESKMFQDLHGLFGIDISPDTTQLLTANFQDGIIENKNARILYSDPSDPNSKIALMYIFADDTSILITDSRDTAHEILLRLASSKVQK